MYVLHNIRRNCISIFGLFLIIILILQKQIAKDIYHPIRKYGLDFKLDYKVVNKFRRRSVLKTIKEDEFSDCNNSVTLENIANISSLDYGIFMMETSGDKIFIKMDKLLKSFRKREAFE